MIESQRLYEIRKKQSTIRGEILQGKEEAMRHGDDEASSVGMLVILPSSFTGGRHRVTAIVGDTNQSGQYSQVVDEIKQRYDCRSLSPLNPCGEFSLMLFIIDGHQYRG
ncbi:hypothetical protein Ahy_B04g072931 [Arachis hypogaea]|uniref:Uncharacterized protein n=1 Tax=Arachis hypogaea TaxID=3818 RepID=A0A444ZP59_ARAHY|nr:hypothetical protein Ahy_B04g072931 [Arachis hypogaea]